MKQKPSPEPKQGNLDPSPPFPPPDPGQPCVKKPKPPKKK